MAVPAFSIPQPLPPDRIGGYQVTRTLTPGRSYLAVSEGGRDVVLKRLDDACLTPDGRQLHPTVRDRLARVRELAIPGIVNLLSVERGDSGAYLVWDYLPGRALHDWLADEPSPPSLDQRRLAAREIVLTLESLHVAGLAHGGVHARNVLLDAQGRWWLTHVSPLLVTDARDDVEAMLRVLRDMRLEIDLPAGATSLRQIRLVLAGTIDGRNESASSPSASSSAIRSADDHDRRVRRRMLVFAFAVTVLAAAVSYAIWIWANSA